MRERNSRIDRRDFIVGSAAVVGSSILPKVYAGDKSKINIGVIGCGDRGAWIANLFGKHTGYNLVAGADYFQDRVNHIGDKFNVPSNRRYTKLSGYKKLLDLKEVDAAVIISPPYFHPDV